MGDSFFGYVKTFRQVKQEVISSWYSFDTSLPPLSEEELRGLTDKNKQDTISTYDHADVYDFATLRDELGAHEEELLEEGDHLADQLIEDGDNNNDITFADAPVGKVFIVCKTHSSR